MVITMRAFTLVLGSLLSLGVMAEDTTNAQDNTSIASPSSTMSNVQVNTGDLAESHYGRGVSCAEPTMSVSATRTPSNGNYYTTGVSFPLTSAFRTSDCDKAARLQNQLNEWEVNDRYVKANRKTEYHQKLMANKELDNAIKEAQLASICIDMHNKMSANPGTMIWEKCNDFAPIIKDHHGVHKVNNELMPDEHERVAANKVDRQ